METHWIKVSERLPDSFQLVIITDGEDIGVGYRYLRAPKVKWSDTLNLIEHESKPVTHWMPLPEPPKD